MTSPLHPDFERVSAVRRGDAGAIVWLTERLQSVPRMVARTTARSSGWTAVDREDAAQEIVHVVLRRLDSYHGLASFEAWVQRICVLSLRSFVRRRKRISNQQLEFEVPATSPDPSVRAADAEQSHLLRRHVDAIGGVEAEVLRLRAIDGLDFADIAARQGIPLATVRTRYYRALEKLRLRLPPP